MKNQIIQKQKQTNKQTKNKQIKQQIKSYDVFMSLDVFYVLTLVRPSQCLQQVHP